VRQANRLHKALEDADVKLSRSSLARRLGPVEYSTRARVGHDRSRGLADLAHGLLRKKLPSLEEHFREPSGLLTR
jgi:hypothetical protein